MPCHPSSPAVADIRRTGFRSGNASSDGPASAASAVASAAQRTGRSAARRPTASISSVIRRLRHAGFWRVLSGTVSGPSSRSRLLTSIMIPPIATQPTSQPSAGVAMSPTTPTGTPPAAGGASSPTGSLGGSSTFGSELVFARYDEGVAELEVLRARHQLRMAKDSLTIADARDANAAAETRYAVAKERVAEAREYVISCLTSGTAV